MTTSPAILLACLAAAPARSAWYDFAKNDSAPEVVELQVAGRQMENLVDVLEMFPDELKGGKLVVRGKASTTRGSIGAVLVSVDGGANFTKAQLERSGAFYFDFSPTIEREHEFQIRAVDTTGRASDPKAGGFKILVLPDKSREEALALFNKLLELYKKRDRAGFMALVAEDFEGNRASLEEGLENDFSSLSSIDIVPSILRIGKVGGVMELEFSFVRRVQSRTSGKVLSDNSRTVMGFIRQGDELRLYSMAAPLIFGVAAGGEAATSVDATAGGDKILAVTAEGDVVKVDQQQTVGATANQTVSNIVTGQLSIVCAMATGDTNTNCSSVALDSRAATRNLTYQQQRHARDMNTGEVSVTAHFNEHPPATAATGCVWVVEPNSLIRDLGVSDPSSVKTVSSDAADYETAIPANGEVRLVAGRVYAVKTPTLYALLKATTANCSYTPPGGGPDVVSVNAVFEYRIQLSQNPAFY
ncbi:MAG: hypothetical protein HY928_03500 [Elusimicrobia bacterium]|nr:hypothetical protein [Elusimicrobiota bacterium]